MRLPYSALVSSPTIEAGISFLAKDSTISLALGGAQASTRDPSLRDVKASIPKRLQTAEVSSEIWIDDFSTRIPSDEAAEFVKRRKDSSLCGVMHCCYPLGSNAYLSSSKRIVHD